MERVILHIDFDSFFASVEQHDHPQFRGKPIGVTATNGRTCIIASSREAKQKGVKTGTRTYEAIRLCPGIQFVPAHFLRYWEISQSFLRICKDYTPFVEVFSIDEVFMDVTQTHHLFGGVEGIVSRIKTRIEKEVGSVITVSVGQSHNKLLAKLASGLEKPNGYVTIGKNDIEKIYKKATLTDICGIGERIKERLYKRRIYTLSDLKQASLAYLIAEFGQVEGRFLKNVGRGIDTTPVLPYTAPVSVKSVGRNYCLPQNTYNQRHILQNVYELCEEVGIKLRRLKKKARTVGFSLRGERSEYSRVTTHFYINDGKDIFLLCLFLYKQWQWNRSSDLRQQMVRQMSVWVTNLQDIASVPLSLFDNSIKKDRLLETVDMINEKFGDHTIRNGFLLYADKLTTVPNGYMADKYERAKLAKTLI